MVMTAFIARDGRLFAKETDDHKAIRAVIDREQNANDYGDGEALLDVHTEDFIAVWARHYDGKTDWLQSKPRYTYDDIKKHVSSGDWAGRSAILSVEAEGILLSYQWFKGDAEIEESDGPSLLLEDLSAESAGEYKVVVSNDSGEATSEVANLTVIDEWSAEIGLVAHFQFEDEEDAGKDSSGNDNNIFDEGVLLADGIKGQALLLERDSRLNDLDEEFELDTHASFTWTAFIKTEDDGGLIAKSPENWSPGSKAIFVREGVLGFDTGWIGDSNGETELIDNKWHHVAIVVEAGEEEDAITLYVDLSLIHI